MRIYKAKDYQDMSRKAANILSAQVIMKPNCVLGLATGSTPIGVYKQLIEWYRKGDLDFSEVKSVNLDEYKGLPKDHDQSYYYFMYTNFFKDINIDINDNVIDETVNKCEFYEFGARRIDKIISKDIENFIIDGVIRGDKNIYIDSIVKKNITS